MPLAITLRVGLEKKKNSRITAKENEVSSFTRKTNIDLYHRSAIRGGITATPTTVVIAEPTTTPCFAFCHILNFLTCFAFVLKTLDISSNLLA
mmetsp:Transcript_3021/g.5713  ORF Transcript_3021/g.5713 Transcript_3021/m.5713 type:complete len:93 (-) Transcript_3021:24-302(-)